MGRAAHMACMKTDTNETVVLGYRFGQRPIPKYILQYQSAWNVRYRLWNTVYYVLAIGSAVFAAVAATGWKEKIQPIRASLFLICITSASFSSILAVLNPKTKAEAYRNASRILESAVLKYQLDPAVAKKTLSAALSTANDCLK